MTLEAGPLPCLGSALGCGYLGTPLPGLQDAEGARVPAGFPPVVDAHVHLFEDRWCEPIWRWFDRWAWPIRHKLRAPAAVDFLLDRGIERLVASQYAHRPGVAESMNQAMAMLCRDRPRVTGLATVFPGEPDAARVLMRAFASGLRGVKIHCHVQCLGPDAPAMEAVYASCVAHDVPLLMHAGREPKSPGYRCDPHELCSADRVEHVLDDHPRLRLCVPHLGADEFDAYRSLLERYDNLWLDTTMAVAGYFPGAQPSGLLEVRPERVLYGTDFPNLPYAWDRELLRIGSARLPDDVLGAVLGGTAKKLYGLEANVRPVAQAGAIRRTPGK